MHKYVTKLRNNWWRYSLWGAFWFIVLVPLVLTFVFISIHEGDTSRQYVPELRKIAAETPMFPGSQKIDETIILKQSRASLFISYGAPVDFDEIESFYKRELPARGWDLPKGPSHRFFEFDSHSRYYRRGDYLIAVEPNGDRYSVAFIWEQQ